MGSTFSFSRRESKRNGRGSFLVSSLRRSKILRRMSWIPRPHLECKVWLANIGLQEYTPLFSGFGGVEEFLYYEKEDLDKLGVRKGCHRDQMLASLVLLRKKYENNQKLKLDPDPRSSLIEGDDRKSHLCNLRLTEEAEIAVRLRNGTSEHRRNSYKREGGILNPVKIEKMMESKKNFELDEGELKKLLEWELSLDSGDLRAHAWYHGSIPRIRAEEIIIENGQFLIRDCISQPGDYVLSCFWAGQILHFVIQKTVVQPHTIYERVQYMLEDEAYDTIPDLITAYVGGKKPITSSSGAKISKPVNRRAPLSYYMSKYAAHSEHTRMHGTLSRPPSKSSQDYRSPAYGFREPIPVPCSIVKTSHSPPRMRRDSGSQIINRARRPSSEIDEKSNSGDGIISAKSLETSSHFSSQSLPRKFHSGALSLPPENHENRPQDTMSKYPVDRPPPKPSRVPSIKSKKPPPPPTGERVYAEIDESDDEESQTPTEDSGKFSFQKSGSYVPVSSHESEPQSMNPRHSRLSEVYQPSGSDSGNGSGDSVQTATSDPRNRNSQVSLGESGFVPVEDDSLAEEDPLLLSLPEFDPPSAFDLENFTTLLLPSIENRPLDHTALKGIKNTLLECGSRILAAHLTKADLDLLNGPSDRDYGLGISMGIELVSLPQGSQLRKDLIERTECLKLLVATTVLKMEDIKERAELIHRWIQVAIDTKTAMGNLYGFTGIMLGLCVPEVQRLSQTWQIVRQKYTDSAFNFESKLRSTLKAMNECTNPQAPNTIIPHILPFILIFERDLEDIYSLHNRGDALMQWESTSSDYGLQILLTHLQEGRNFTQNLSLYKRNADLIMGEMEHTDELTLDMFRTEFHLKFLYGSRAAFADGSERLPKFQKVISTLSDHCEPHTVEAN